MAQVLVLASSLDKKIVGIFDVAASSRGVLLHL